MRNTVNPHLPITHRLARSCSLAVVLACASLSAKALSLGHFSVESGLGQPLRAAIEITQYTVDDLRKLKVQLAQPGSFAQAGMVFQPALVGMQTRLEFRGNGKPFIALTGQTPVDEHFLDVIVEVQWPSGRLAMNYTLLVSPVGALPEKVANPASAQKPDGVLSPVVTAPVPAGDPPVATAQEASPLEVVTVRAGDTASQLALGKIPAAASMDQMLLAMVRANPEAFIEGNVHLLREGAQIKLPSEAQALAISAQEARQIVVAQTVDFVDYARRLAQSALKAKDTATREMSGKLNPAQSTPAAPTPAQDKLTLSKRELTADSAEARLAVEREIQEKTQQLAALKQNLESLKALSATAAEASASNESPALGQPSVPLAAAASTPRSLLDKLSQTPSLWLWVVAVLAAMLALVAVARRRNKGNGEIFGAQGPEGQPPAGLPPQFAHLDLNLNAASEPAPRPQVIDPSGPRP